LFLVPLSVSLFLSFFHLLLLIHHGSSSQKSVNSRNRPLKLSFLHSSTDPGSTKQQQQQQQQQ
jgi:hypothetical protein